jgi:hypothetical protein
MPCWIWPVNIMFRLPNRKRNCIFWRSNFGGNTKSYSSQEGVEHCPKSVPGSATRHSSFFCLWLCREGVEAPILKKIR